MQLLAGGMTTYTNPLFEARPGDISSALDLPPSKTVIRPCISITAAADAATALAFLSPSALQVTVLLNASHLVTDSVCLLHTAFQQVSSQHCGHGCCYNFAAMLGIHSSTVAAFGSVNCESLA